MTYVDTSALYHIVRGQSVIKLYVIYNMLEVRDHVSSYDVIVIFVMWPGIMCLEIYQIIKIEG